MKRTRFNTDTLYGRLAADLVNLIDAGTLMPGDRLPSIRRFATSEGVSITTVLEAYRRLEDLGLVEARPQSGFFVRSGAGRDLPEPRTPPTSPEPRAVQLLELADSLVADAGRSDLLPLGASVPAPELLPIKKIARMLGSAVRAQPELAISGLMPLGLPGLRRAVAGRVLRGGAKVAPEEVIITAGALEALTISLQSLTSPQDGVAIETPTYFGVLQVLKSLGLRAIEVPASSAEGLDLDALERQFAQGTARACVVTPNGHNPLGYVMDDDAKQRLVELASTYEVPLIEDDVYGDLFFASSRPRSLKSFDKDGWVLQCGSVSKTLAPALRIGWVLPGRYLQQVVRSKLTSSYGAATPSQMVVAEYLESGGFDLHLRSLRRLAADNCERMRARIAQTFPEGTSVSRPAGGYVLWIELPPRVDALELYRRALAVHIGTAPGPMFSACGGYSNFVRLSVAFAWRSRIDDGLDRLGRIVRDLAD